MLYQIRANLYFSNEAPTRAIREALQKLWSQALVVNAGQPHAEPSEIEVIENHHDTDPAAPCVLLYHLKKQP
jgi:hypothetical protein